MKDALSAKDARLKELELKLPRLEDLEAEVKLLQSIVGALKTENLKQEEKIVALQQQIDERPANYLLSEFAIHPGSVESNENKTALAATGIPKSCADLRYMGHSASGIYLIMGVGKVETVYCDFTVLPSDPSKVTFHTLYFAKLINLNSGNYKSVKYMSTFCFAGFQTWIGQVDVKSLPVYFYVQRLGVFSIENTPIPFENEILNVGGAMNRNTGIFTAPRDGIYAFSFTGLAYFPASSSVVALEIFMYLNGNVVGRGHGDEVGTVIQYESFSFQSMLNLRNGDEIWLEIVFTSTGAELYGSQYTKFSGYLLEENIAIA